MMSATLPEGVRFGKSVLINPWVVSLSEIQNAKSLDEPQMKTRQIFLFRHGQTDWNKEGRIQGNIDVPLNDFGRTQAARLQPIFRELGIQAILSSDLSRARQSAELATSELDIPLHLDPGLREIHLGKLEGLSRAEIEERFGIQFSQNLSHRPLSDQEITALSSEHGSQVVARALQALDRFFGESHGAEIERLAVASHGGVVRRVLQAALATDVFPAPVTNAAIYPITVTWEPRITLRLETVLPIPAKATLR
jgi:broad specificity phosphatase PhoE